MRAFFAVGLLATGALAGAAACGSSADTTRAGSGSSTGSTSSGTGGGAPASSCADFAKTVCARFEKCAPAYVSLFWGDEAACTAREELACGALVGGPGATSAGSDIAACTALIGAAGSGCDDLFGPLFQCKFSPGTLGKGAPCGDSQQCASSYCDVAVGSICGTCQDSIPAGASCANDKKACATGTLCDGTMTCSAPIPKGGSCSPSQTCETSYDCFNGTCVQGGLPGAACGSGQPACNALAGHCDTKTNLCAAYEVVAAGQPCGTINGQLVGCAALAKCKIAQGMTTGVCEAPVADGAACGGSSGVVCQVPAKCVNSVCTLPDPAACK